MCHGSLHSSANERLHDEFISTTTISVIQAKKKQRERERKKRSEIDISCLNKLRNKTIVINFINLHVKLNFDHF